MFYIKSIMENFVNQYSTFNNIGEVDYSNVQGEFPVTYGNSESYTTYPAEDYSNNIIDNQITTSYSTNVDITTGTTGFNDLNINNYSTPVETYNNYTTSTYEISGSTPYITSSNTYNVSNNITTTYGETYNTNINETTGDILMQSSIIDNNIDTTHQPSYQTSSYIDTNNIINNVDYNIPTNINEYTTSSNNLGLITDTTPIQYNTTSNIVKYEINSSPVDYNINSNFIDYNITSNVPNYNIISHPVDNFIDNNIYTGDNTNYILQDDRQDNELYKSFEPSKPNNGLISELRNSYFNINNIDTNNIPYSVSSYNPNRYTTTSYSNSILNPDLNEYSKYSTSSVPLHIPPNAETETEIIPVEEIEYIPVKRKKLIKKTKIKIPVKKTIIIPKKVVVPVPVKKTVYIKKKKKIIIPQTKVTVLPPTTIETERPLSPIRSSVKVVPLSPVRVNSDLRGSGIYSPKVYRINLNKK